MGATLVMSAYTYWTALPNAPFRLLVRMAVTAKDGDREPVAWIGQKHLATALGLPQTPNSYRCVRRHLQVLIEAGAIERIEVGQLGRNSAFRLIHNPVQLVDDPIMRMIKEGRGDPP